jgi:hypothetical protein
MKQSILIKGANLINQSKGGVPFVRKDKTICIYMVMTVITHLGYIGNKLEVGDFLKPLLYREINKFRPMRNKSTFLFRSQ